MSFKSTWCRSIARVFAPLIFTLPLAAQDSLRLNVPYACPDGSTYVVHKCEQGPKFEFCYYQRDQNSERYNVRAQRVTLKLIRCCLRRASLPSNFRMAPRLSRLSCS